MSGRCIRSDSQWTDGTDFYGSLEACEGYQVNQILRQALEENDPGALVEAMKYAESIEGSQNVEKFLLNKGRKRLAKMTECTEDNDGFWSDGDNLYSSLEACQKHQAAERKRLRARRGLGGGKSNKKKRKSLRKKRKTTKKKRKTKKR